MEDLIVIVFWVIAGIIWLLQKIFTKGEEQQPFDLEDFFGEEKQETYQPDFQQPEAAKEIIEEDLNPYQNVDYSSLVNYDEAQSVSSRIESVDSPYALDEQDVDVHRKKSKSKKKRSLKNKAELRKAIIMREILDQPRAFET